MRRSGRWRGTGFGWEQAGELTFNLGAKLIGQPRQEPERIRRDAVARMRYLAFRAAGLPVGSGVVESACGAVAGRLERGANPVLTLRCWWLDGRHDEFFKMRARPPPMALAA